MKTVSGFIVLLDISGYTRFVRAHNLGVIPALGRRFQSTGEAHAETIVTDLLETLIKATDDLLKPEKLEGDAVLLTAITDRPMDEGRQLIERLQGIFDVFRRRLHELQFCQTCLCDCCAQMDQLRVKGVVHHGQFLLKSVAGFREIAGQAVIRAHRLLKNEVVGDEYLLITDAVAKLCESNTGHGFARHVETDEDLGETVVWVHHPKTPTMIDVINHGGYLTRFKKMKAYFAEPRDRSGLLSAANSSPVHT